MPCHAILDHILNHTTPQFTTLHSTTLRTIKQFLKIQNTKIGTFPWPWEEKGKPSALSEYGLGLVFYFKMLKSLAILFAIISAVTIPSLGLYIAAKSKTNAESNYQIITHSERLLGAKVIISYTYIYIIYILYILSYIIIP